MELHQSHVEIGQFRRFLETFCLSETAAHSDIFMYALEANILTYLLTIICV